ncbi:MAG: hypothetical protein SFU87_11690 [Chitinophagaceae bacterium]|nr:hypothetical protein [Chitinophagaceae bacterium]
MRRVLLILSFLCAAKFIVAQDNSATIFNGAGDFKRILGLQTDFSDVKDKMGGKRIEGNPYLHEFFYKGYIRFFNDQVMQGIPMRFNLINQGIHFMDGDRELVLNTPVKEFGYTVTEDGKENQFVFRNGFPPVAGNTEETLYIVLAGDKTVLLKNDVKKMREAVALNGQNYYKITESETYFVYDAKTKQIKKISRDKNSVLEAIPDKKTQIENVCQQYKLKCRSENELKLLFSLLD